MEKIAIRVLLFLVLAITGCATNAPKELSNRSKELNPLPGSSIIYMMRPWAYRASLAELGIKFNSLYVGTLGTNQYLVLYAKPQKAVVSEQTTGSNIEFNVEKDRKYFITMTVEMSINLFEPPVFRLLDEAEGRSLLAEYSLSESSSFGYACGFGDLALAKQVFLQSQKYGTDEEQTMQRALCLATAASNGNLEILRWGVETAKLPINVFVYGNNIESTIPLKAALESGHLEAAEYLLEKGAYPFASSPTFNYVALNTAVENNRFDHVELLIRKGANPNVYFNRESPLIVAIKNNRLEIAKYLLEHGAFVSYYESSIEDPLTVARHYQRYQFEQMLLKAGAIDRQAIARSEEALASAQRQEALSNIGEAVGQVMGFALGVAAIYYVEKQSAYGNVGTNSSEYTPYQRSLKATSTNESIDNIKNKSSIYERPPINNNGSQNQSLTITDTNACTTDTSCGAGYVCIKKMYASSGVCLQSVDQNGTRIFNTKTNQGSWFKNKNGCNVNADCTVGFSCDSELKECVK